MGKFIVFEGIDKSGKSTQISIINDWLNNRGIKSCIVREPGTTDLGKIISDLVKKQLNVEISPRALKHLFMAARAELIDEQLINKLNEYDIVLSDRFALSTLCYQVIPDFKNRIDEFDLDCNAVMHTFANEMKLIWNKEPDLNIVFDINFETYIKRVLGENTIIPDKDRFEQDYEFIKNVISNYHSLRSLNEFEHTSLFGECVFVEADKPIETVTEKLKEIISSLLIIQ